MFKRKQEKKTKRLTCQPFQLAKMSFGMRANRVTYIWKKLLTAAVEILRNVDGNPMVVYIGWTSHF